MNNAKHYWVRFFSPGDDPRPVKVPAPCQWWCTGYTGEDSVICALVLSESGEPATALEEWWPELRLDSCDERPVGWVPGDRFTQKPSSQDSWIEQVVS